MRFLVSLFSRLCVALALVLAASGVSAQPYPSKPIRLIVPFSIGGPNDLAARILSEALAKRLGQPVLVDNRPGASGNIAAQIAARARNDGYTLFWAQPATHGINPAMQATIPYDPVADFAPIALVGAVTIALVVHPQLPVTSVRELIEYAKARPGQLNFGSPGNGTTPHMAAELFSSLAGVQLVHVPYNNSFAAIQDLTTGRIAMLFDGVQLLKPYIDSGAIRALAVSTAARNPALPQVPPLAMTLPGYDVSSWSGIVAPAGTPEPVLSRLNHEVNEALHTPDVTSRYEKLGMTVQGGTREQMAAHILQELQKWRRVVAASGIHQN